MRTYKYASAASLISYILLMTVNPTIVAWFAIATVALNLIAVMTVERMIKDAEIKKNEQALAQTLYDVSRIKNII